MQVELFKFLGCSNKQNKFQIDEILILKNFLG